jgi:hypothetical protein
MAIPVWFEIVFWSFALAVSAFLGGLCYEVHRLYRQDKWPREIQEMWLNFVGAIAGWIALWLLVRQWWGIWWVASVPPVPIHLSVSDYVLGLVAFVGISGYLPYTVIGSLQIFVPLVHKLVERTMKLLFPEATA